MTPWQYNGNDITSVPDNQYGFIYLITNHIFQKYYIGKKVFWHNRIMPPLKGKKRNRHQVHESDWKSYWGSNELLLADINKLGIRNFSRSILCFCEDKTELTYAETQAIFILDALDDDRFYNSNILGKFYKSKYDSRLENSKKFIELRRLIL